MKNRDKLLLGLSIIASTLVGSPSFSQNQENIKKETNKELVENLDSTSNQGITQSKFKWILDDYGADKGLELIQTNTILEINKIRKGMGLNELTIDSSLSQAAQDYAIEMNNTGKFGHIGKNKSTPKTRAQATGYRSDFIYENLGKDFLSIQKTIEWWMGSKIHADNILRNNISKIGVGYYNAYIVVMFAK